MFQNQSHKHELHTVAKGSAYQCDLTNRIYLDFKGNVLAFKIQDFFAFRRKVHAVNIHDMIFNLSDDFDFEVIESPQNQLSLKLALCDIIHLRDLLDGAKFALDTLTMLHEVLGEFEIA